VQLTHSVNNNVVIIIRSTDGNTQGAPGNTRDWSTTLCWTWITLQGLISIRLCIVRIG